MSDRQTDEEDDGRVWDDTRLEDLDYGDEPDEDDDEDKNEDDQ